MTVYVTILHLTCMFILKLLMHVPSHASYIYKGIKMFPSKTSRDVGMVDGVSDATSTGSSMENPTGEKSPGTRRSIL